VLGCGGRCSRVVVALVAMADFLVLLVLVSSLFASAGAAVDHFVMESIVTSGQREGPAFFSWFLVSVGSDLGGHGRPPGLFDSYIISSIICCSWRRRRSFCD
jgi:hypothetical protein